MRRRCGGTNSDALRSSDDRCATSEPEEDKTEEKTESRKYREGERRTVAGEGRR